MSKNVNGCVAWAFAFCQYSLRHLTVQLTPFAGTE